jgi:hypothetical protein
MKQKRNSDNTIKFRVRGTAGGERLSVPYDVSAQTVGLDVSAQTAGLDVVKILIHSTVSGCRKWRTIDITDYYYLGTPLPLPLTPTLTLNHTH